MDDTRLPEPGARLDEQAQRTDQTTDLPSAEAPAPRRQGWFGAIRRRRLDKIGGRLRVVGPAVQVAPQQPAQSPRRRSAAWRVFFGLLKTILFVATLGAVAA